MPGFAVVELEPQPFAYLTRRARITEIPQVMAACFALLGEAFARAKAVPAGPPLSHYLDYDARWSTFEVGFPICPLHAEALRDAGLAIGETPAGKVMQGRHVGPYDTLHLAYDAMTNAMHRDRLEGTHDMWERYLSPPETPPAEVETEIMWPVHAAA